MAPEIAAKESVAKESGAKEIVAKEVIAKKEGSGETERKYEGGWEAVLALPCQLTVELPLPGFKVGDLVHLGRGMVIDSQWHAGDDVPLRVNGQLVAWSEFEVVGNRLAVRITELQ